jgi:hypothetical protein
MIKNETHRKIRAYNLSGAPPVESYHRGLKCSLFERKVRSESGRIVSDSRSGEVELRVHKWRIAGAET